MHVWPSYLSGGVGVTKGVGSHEGEHGPHSCKTRGEKRAERQSAGWCEDSGLHTIRLHHMSMIEQRVT